MTISSCTLQKVATKLPCPLPPCRVIEHRSGWGHLSSWFDLKQAKENVGVSSGTRTGESVHFSFSVL